MGLIGYGGNERENSGSHCAEEFSDPSPHEERHQHPLVLTGEAIFSDEPRMVR